MDSARATASRLAMPPERLADSVSRKPESSGRSTADSTERAIGRIAGSSRFPTSRSHSAMLSNTVPENSALRWKTTPQRA